MANVANLLRKYNDIVSKMDPDSAIGDAFLATGAPIRYPVTDPATVANWTDSAINQAKALGDTESEKKLDSLLEEVAAQSTIPGVNRELSTLYLTGYDLQNAEVNLQAVANLSEKTITKEKQSGIRSFANRFYNSVEGAVKRIHGIITGNLKNLKDKVENLKKAITEAPSKLKEKFLDAFNSILDGFFAIINDAVNRIFSFIDMVNTVAEGRGYRLKSLSISFEPPSFEKVTVLGVPLPLPKISLPKADIGFERIELTK